MDEEDYVKLAEEMIREAESRSHADPIESFYRGIQTMISTLRARLECAAFDGVDLT